MPNSADEVPEDLLNALEVNQSAKKIFLKLPPSHKREYVKWINEAKKPETRVRRIEKTLERLLDE